MKFSQKTTDIVAQINEGLLKSGKLSTNPDPILYFLAYDSCCNSDFVTPRDSICRYTIDGLKHIFPLIKIELKGEEIYVEEKLFDYSAFPPNGQGENHINYIKEIMLDVFLMFQNDEAKIPKSLYRWYFQETI